MHWLHVLTGFQLWVIATLLGFSSQHHLRKYDESKAKLKPNTGALINAALFAVEALFFSAYWYWVAVFPVIGLR